MKVQLSSILSPYLVELCAKVPLNGRSCQKQLMAAIKKLFVTTYDIFYALTLEAKILNITQCLLLMFRLFM